MRILFYFMHNPCPPRSGAHQRCLQIVRELKTAGHEVIFASSILHTEQPWAEDSKTAIADLTGQPVYIYGDPGRIGWRINTVEKKIRQFVLKKNGFRESLFCPITLIRWFRKLVDKIKPDVIFLNYAWFDQLIDHESWQQKYCAIEIHDLVSINGQMRQFVEGQLAVYATNSDASKFREEFNTAKLGFKVNPEEVEIYQRYDTVVCISKTEQNVLQSLLKGVNVVHAPFKLPPSDLANTYQGPAILSLGPNPFNTQGFIYFHDVILPQILKQSPGFRLIVTGSIQPKLCRHPAIEFKGFVKNRDAFFQEAGYAVCPVFAGTGQQIKIEEAMAYGLAVVAFREAAENSSLKHGENALVANTPDEFARHIAGLQNDLELRSRLGQAAKKTIIQQWENPGGFHDFGANIKRGADKNRSMAGSANHAQ